MHLGNVFSALLAWLSVRSCGGTMVLRIEDLDPARCRAEYAEQIRRDLQWLGLDWDVEQTPQSRRTRAYQQQFDRLSEQNLVYPCFCSRNELLAASAPHASDLQPVYPGTCRNLMQQERETRRKLPSWRLIVPDETICFTDGLQGSVQENLLRSCGDFIIRRADGVYAYQLAVVCDDAQGGITQIVRGRDLLSSVPRQMYLQRLLGFETPQYYHVPLLLAADGRRLSKRERDLDLGALQQRLCAPELIGRLAFLAGLLPKPEAIQAAELVAEFDWSRVHPEDIVVPEALF